MKERIEAALSIIKRGGSLTEVIDDLSKFAGQENIDAALFAAKRGNVEETVEHLNAALAAVGPELMSALTADPKQPKRR